LLDGNRVARWRNIETVAPRKLAMLNRAAVLTDLKIRPNNHLEALKDDRKGQHSIRENDQLLRVDGERTEECRDRRLPLIDYH
jgi:proteic killer suppression protein